MRDIRGIIEELRQHPDFIACDVTTINDVIWSFNSELEDTSNYEVSYDDLTHEDWLYITNAIENMYERILIYSESGYPKWKDLPDLPKRIQRDIKISEILKNKNEI